MSSPALSIAVVIPCLNARHRLWRSIASVAAQSLRPAQVVVVGYDSTDGLADWLRVRWPGIELCTVPVHADVMTGAASVVTTPFVATLAPGEHWHPRHLERLAGQQHRSGRASGLLPTRELSAAGAPMLPWRLEASDEPEPDGRAIEQALAALPAGNEALLLGLRAASEPAGLLDMLGLAASVGALGRMPRAFTLADLSWGTLQTVPAATPLLISLGAPLDLRRASEQLCVEELAGRSRDRPVRLIVRGLGPSPPKLLSRLLEAVTAHPDLELWVSDAVSRRYAISLLEHRRVRLVPPPMLSLSANLRQLGLGQLIEPGTLGAKSDGPDLAVRMASHAAWWQGFDPEATRRVGLALSRVLGNWRWLKGPLLQQAWLTALVGWAAVRAGEPQPRTACLDIALFTALCGRPIPLDPEETKDRDLVATWRTYLEQHGMLLG
ncbi:MAG: glycosyltransferase family 2 protein [Geminicoccaceae bacterium]